MTRRALVAGAGGGALLLAGCGRDEAAAPPPRAADALLGQLAAERAVVAAFDGLPELAPREQRALVARLGARASERAQRLAAALSAAGGRPHDAPQGAASAPDPAAAQTAQRAALTAHADAVPVLAGREQRDLVADLVAETATDLVLLAGAFGSARAEAFPA